MERRQTVEFAVKSSAAALVAVAGAAQAQDLQGLYGGLSLNKASGDLSDLQECCYSFDGNTVGGFIGYNHVFGDWLVGAELSIANDGIEAVNSAAPNFMHITHLRELKARVGHVFGKTVVYGVVGRSQMDVDMWGSLSIAADGEAKATALGLGFETALGGKMFVGGEYLTRDLDLSAGPAFYADQGATLKTLSLRMGLRF